MPTLKFHPIAEIFPLLEGPEFADLVADIAEYGQHEPIWLYEGLILDGRNRYRACVELGLKPETCEYQGDDPEAYVISMNLHRRHLNESQRAMCAARMANMERGGDRKSIQYNSDQTANWQFDRASAADTFKVNERSVNRAAKVLHEATPDVIEATDKGHLPVSAAAKIVTEPPDFQDDVAQRVTAGTRPQEAIRQAKAERITQRAIEQPTGRYRVLYADPPWSYGNTQPDYHPEQRDHYPVMSLTDICALPVVEWVEDDAVLFLWVTSPILEEAFRVVKAWGFTYKSSFVWDKIKHNMGHYNSVRHELLLVCTRGSCLPDVAKLFDSVQSIERTAHSAKPEEFRQIIDTVYPYGERIELFARRHVAGWAAWGLEA